MSVSVHVQRAPCWATGSVLSRSTWHQMWQIANKFIEFTKNLESSRGVCEVDGNLSISGDLPFTTLLPPIQSAADRECSESAHHLWIARYRMRQYIIDDVTSRGAWRQQTAAESSDNTTTAFIANPTTTTLEVRNCNRFEYIVLLWSSIRCSCALWSGQIVLYSETEHGKPYTIMLLFFIVSLISDSAVV